MKLFISLFDRENVVSVKQIWLSQGFVCSGYWRSDAFSGIVQLYVILTQIMWLSAQKCWIWHRAVDLSNKVKICLAGRLIEKTMYMYLTGSTPECSHPPSVILHSQTNNTIQTSLDQLELTSQYKVIQKDGIFGLMVMNHLAVIGFEIVRERWKTDSFFLNRLFSKGRL